MTWGIAGERFFFFFFVGSVPKAALSRFTEEREKRWKRVEKFVVIHALSVLSDLITQVILRSLFAVNL